MYKTMIKNARSLNRELVVSIGSGGVTYLNAPTMRGQFKGVEAVTFLYDEEAKKLAIKPVKPGEPNSFQLSFSNVTHSTGVIAGRSVVRELELDYEKSTLLFAAVWNPKLGALEIDLRAYRTKTRKRR